ncbi:MAG: NAD+ synthase [Nitrososphaeria archaeon]
MDTSVTTLRGLSFDVIYEKITEFLSEMIGERYAVIGLSGGVDSSLTAYFLANSISKNRIFAFLLPDSTSTPEDDINDARELANELDISYRIVYIDQIAKTYLSVLEPGDNRAVGNLKARIRMSILYYYANKLGGLVVGTGDKSELYLGYFTKYGDGGVDILPIGDLYKTEVREAAEHFQLPESIVKKKSSPRLWPGQTAEDELGISYEVADRILYELIDLKRPRDEVINKWKDKAQRVLSLMDSSQHKRSLPAIARLT